MCRKIFFVVLLMLSLNVAAQHPFSEDWRVLKTPNAKFIYPSYLGFDVSRLAGGLDRIVAADTANVGLLPKRLPIILSAPSNTSNGFTSLSPYRMVLYTVPSNTTDLGSSEWFQTLITHEYRHIVQYRMFDRGITKVAHNLFGFMGWSAMMYSVPDWLYEGDAVYAETVTSSQGRGRTANFEMPISALLLDNNGLYPYDKIVHRSYRDMIPNHYPVGYMLTTNAKRKYGADVFGRVARRHSYYSFWPFAFGCGFKYCTGEKLADNYKNTFNELKDFYKKRSGTLETRDYPAANNTKKRFYTNFYSPVVIGDNRILCINSSMAKAAKLVILDTTGRVEQVLGHTDAGRIDSDGNIAVYVTDVPDVRWSERYYSDIAVFNLSDKTCSVATKKGKYNSVALSRDGKKLVAVEFTENRVCKLVVLSLKRDGSQYRAVVEKSYYGRPLEFFRSPNFLDDHRVVYVSNYKNQNAIRILDFDSMQTTDVTSYSPENIPEVYPSDDAGTVFYISDLCGIDNIYRVPVSGGDASQVSSVKYGLDGIFVRGDKIFFNNYTAKGYNVAYCSAGDTVEPHAPVRLDYYKPLLPKEPAASLDFLASQTPDTSILSTSKKYHQFSDPFRFLGWIPNVEEGVYSATAYTSNNLGTLDMGVRASYDTDFELWRTDWSLQYSGFYPVLNFNASIGKEGVIISGLEGIMGLFLNGTVHTWRENVYSASVTLPFNLSRLWYRQYLELGTGLHWFDVDGRPTNYYDEVPENGFAVWSAAASYSWSRHSAYRDFKNPLSFSSNIGVYKSISGGDKEAYMTTASASLTTPGFFRQNYFSVSGNYVWQLHNDADNVYLLDNSAFDIRGYESVRLQELMKVSVDYSFPLGYPDFGIPCVIWIKRFRGGVFGDVAKGSLFDYDFDFASAGVKFMADFCMFRINYDFTAGVSFAKGLKDNDLSTSEVSLILSLPF